MSKKEKDKDFDEIYMVEVKCQNCKRPNWLRIALGTTVQEFGEEENPTCQSCSCPVIKLKEKKEED
jgi:hypothetical protein